ncbi:MAG: glycoside hydrolase family 57 protein [Nitrospiraceae bacterium]|nr:glycoside hydrolase family 57 protein [Nitrospiraceae bacterium]
MTDNPLFVSFLWHMHQPYYKDPLSGYYRLPWVRLHGTKDYLDMVEILRDFPAIRQNFNLVPSLIEQIIEYEEGGAKDLFLELSEKSPPNLSQDEKIFILENFFLANWDNMIRPFPRYHELLVKRGTHLIRSDLVRTAKYFRDGDFLDLQVYFNLCWIDPFFREKDDLLRSLCAKGKNFTGEDKRLLLAKQREILGRIIPAYREMASTGRIELSFSPFYHPILPLLCDTDVARASMPNVNLPRQRFAHPEDADMQIRSGRELFEKVFGFRPAGMWPSEGSVSEEVLRLASRNGVRWVATDEGVLANSLGRRLRDDSGNMADPGALYRPYRFEDVAITFRDHALSDLIGFVYSQWEPKRAAADLIQRLTSIRRSLPGGAPRLVSIILDGENAWEYYRNDGRDFFLYLYEGLSREEGLKTVTVSDFLAHYGGGEPLGRIQPGSWINANFGIWLGHEEDNLAWDYLSETRRKLVEHERQNPGAETKNAWRSLFIAEGSDWNWWYGDEHTTETQKEFDELFRFNLMKVFREIGRDVPARLFEPILREDRGVAPTQSVRGFISPKIDGMVTSYYEWYQGAQLDVKKSGGSMHKSESLVAAVYYGFDRTALYLRVDPRTPFAEFEEGTAFVIVVSGPAEMKIACPLSKGRVPATLYEKTGEDWIEVKELPDAAAVDIFEVGVPFADLKAVEKDEINIFISIRKGEEEIERCPWRGHVTVSVPTEDFEAMLWH